MCHPQLAHERIQPRECRKGLKSLDELKAQTPKPVKELVGTPRKPDAPSKKASTTPSRWTPTERKDSSPIKVRFLSVSFSPLPFLPSAQLPLHPIYIQPLSSFFNTARIMASPHTAEQISSLWLVYHGSRSNGTGRGYLSASMSREQYEGMLARAKKYPIFIVPLPVAVAEGEEPATEFYFVQWDIYDRPELPTASDDALDALFSSQSSSSSSSSTSSPPSTDLPPPARDCHPHPTRRV